MVGGEYYEEEKFKVSGACEKYYIEDNEWEVLIP